MARFLRSALMLVVVVVMASNVGQAKVDHQGCKDYPLLTRVPGFYIKGCRELPFAAHKFTTKKGKKEVEGHFISISYGLPEGAASMSGLEMVRNYTNAVRKIGGSVLYEGRYSGSMRISVEGRSETSHFPHDLGGQGFPRRRTRVRHTRGTAGRRRDCKEGPFLDEDGLAGELVVDPGEQGAADRAVDEPPYQAHKGAGHGEGVAEVKVVKHPDQLACVAECHQPQGGYKDRAAPEYSSGEGKSLDVESHGKPPFSSIRPLLSNCHHDTTCLGSAAPWNPSSPKQSWISKRRSPDTWWGVRLLSPYSSFRQKSCDTSVS